MGVLASTNVECPGQCLRYLHGLKLVLSLQLSEEIDIKAKPGMSMFKYSNKHALILLGDHI